IADHGEQERARHRPEGEPERPALEPPPNAPREDGDHERHHHRRPDDHAQEEAEVDDASPEGPRRGGGAGAGRGRGLEQRTDQGEYPARAHRRTPGLNRPKAIASAAASASAPVTQGNDRPASTPTLTSARPTPDSKAGTATASTARTICMPGRATNRAYRAP